jgi:signal transduction histidine kinase
LATLSLWLTGALFALLGAVVLVRRPDTSVARLFGLFAGLTGVAFAVSPAAGGVHSAWSLAVQFLSLLGLAASLPAFATAFVGDSSGSRSALRFSGLAGGILLAGYLVSLFIRPSFYSEVRIGFAIFFVGSILAALIVLARKVVVRHPPRSARDARLALTGIACGTLPFLGLTMIPQSTLHSDLTPGYVTAVLWSAIPLTFAYAILRHQTLGIRRLVHRGMVYGITTVVTLAIVFLLVVAVDSRSAWASAALLALGALLFHVLSRGVRILVNRLFYPDEVDSGALLAAMRNEIVGSAHVEEVAAAMVKKLRDSLRLEAVSLFLGTTAETLRVTASAGSRADESIAFVRPRLLEMDLGEHGMSETRWNSDVLLIARLESSGHTLGFLVLGPKEKGEVFLREERRLVETVTPILALAIRETSLLAELREVTERLTDAQEAERGRIARDLHDGPLQKAILLGGGADVTFRDRNGVARELAAELRELCARLRPAILDDLGLVPALEWLLEQTAQGFTVTPRLTLRGMTEDDRLEPNAELALFRVTQEAVSNALKHGHARSIHVSLTKTIYGVELSVTDDGDGAAMAGDLTRGLGIPGMRERLRQVGGSVSIASDRRTGTMVSARIPYVVHGEQ